MQKPTPAKAMAGRQKKFLAKVSAVASAIFFPLLALAQTTSGGWSPSTYDSTGLPKASVQDIITKVLNWILTIFGFIALIGFVISGIMYLTAAGDEDRQEQAKRAMYYSITGVIVGLVGLVIIYAVNNLLNATGNI